MRPATLSGPTRRVLVPDRLLLMELAPEGQFRQAPALLWFLRLYGQRFSLERQHRAFFPNGRPLYTYVPWWISHAAVLTWMLGVCGQRTPAISRRAGFQLGGSYLWKAGLLYFRQELTSIRPASKRRHKFRPDLILWRYFKAKRKAFRNWRAPQVRKWLRRRQYHYRMVLWQYYKTNREAFRKWRTR